MKFDTYDVELRRGPLDGALAGRGGEEEDKDPEAREEEGERGGHVAVQLEVLVQSEGDPHAGQEENGSSRLKI